MKKHSLSIRIIYAIAEAIMSLGRPHPQTTTDGKTVTRDFEIHPKAKVLLSQNQKALREICDDIEAMRVDMVQKFLPKGEENHSPEENAAFRKEYNTLMRETRDVCLYPLWLYYEKTDKPDAIDLTKAAIPHHLLSPLLDTVLLLPDVAP